MCNQSPYLVRVFLIVCCIKRQIAQLKEYFIAKFVFWKTIVYDEWNNTIGRIHREFNNNTLVDLNDTPMTDHPRMLPIMPLLLAIDLSPTPAASVDRHAFCSGHRRVTCVVSAICNRCTLDRIHTWIMNIIHGVLSREENPINSRRSFNKRSE